MKLCLKPKKIDIRTGYKFIAVLHEDTAHKLDMYVGDRVILKNKKHKICAILEITEDELKRDHIGLYSETYKKLNVKKGDVISAEIAPKPESVQFIRDKLNGKKLDAKSIDMIIKDVVNEDLSDVELTYFVSGCYVHGLTDNETADLTKAIVNNGSRLNFKNKIVMDKHCIGGVPNNRTTMLVVPIITALGFKMPKTSSRAITSPSGTGDTMEVLANVTNTAVKLKKIASKVNGFITWGGGVDLAAADDKMIRVRHPLKLDPEGMLLASIMAKKFSVSANTVIIDIPVGPEAKIADLKKARHLKARFLKIAKLLKMKMRVIISDGSQPVGNGIGPVLEAIDVMSILKNEEGAPADLREKALRMAGILIDMSGKFWWKRGYAVAKKVLSSGKAYDQMQKIINEQGAKKKALRPGNFHFDVLGWKNGKVKHINNKMVAKIARFAGCPKDVSSGVYLHKKVGDEVKKNEKVFTIYANSEERLNFAVKYATDAKAYDVV
ncbi:thymidine phosphorylase family protein [Patescibacteria group bacterium]|nr:thymidine phosphorylase family protein [Patescibacteria group bacterium]